MKNFLELIIIVIVGAQFGVALTASIVVHPILLKVKRISAIEFFKPFFNLTHKAVLYMSITASIIALIVSLLSGNWTWFGVSLIMHLNGPFTLFLMMPINNRLMSDNVDPSSRETFSDLNNWGKLHAVRTIINGVVFCLFVYILIFY